MCYRHSLQDAKMQEKSRTRNCERTNQKVTATKEVLIVKIFINNLCVHCTVPAKFKSHNRLYSTSVFTVKATFFAYGFSRSVQQKYSQLYEININFKPWFGLEK